MDLYALSRMTNPITKMLLYWLDTTTIIIIFIFSIYQSTILWRESLSEKCIKVPEWTPRKNRLFGLIGGKTRKRVIQKKEKEGVIKLEK